MGHYLRGMHPVADPQALIDFAYGLEARGGKGFLLSGGCQADGTIPLSPYYHAIRTIKDTTDLEMNIHTGLLDERGASSLVETGADAFSVDVVQDVDVMRGLLGLQASPEAYATTLQGLEDAGARVVPHICAGLPLSSLEGERKAIELVSHHRPQALVVLGFIPTPGTPTGDHPPPHPSRILAVIERAREAMDCPVILGCMRDRGHRGLEIDCIRAGVDGIANPSRSTVEWVRGAGYLLQIEEKCCAIYL